MGYEMAINLAKAKYEVTGFDINKEKYRELEEKNVICVNSINEVVNSPDVIILMLPDGKIVKTVWELSHTAIATLYRIIAIAMV